MSPTLLMVGVRSLGRSIALHFARQGWTVLCAARTEASVEALASEVGSAGGTGIPLTCDLRDPQSLHGLRDHAHIDLCIAAQTAGGRLGPRPLLDTDDDELERAITSYVRGTWNLLKIVGRKMAEQQAGTFLQIGTSSGVRTKEGFAPLGAAQHALRALVQVAAREWRGHGVHVAYLPIDGGIESERSADWIARKGVDRAIPPDDIARACEYLHRQDRRAWTHELLLRPPGNEWLAPT
jgi:NAD(P)-dependent dehydrogenase (short-subunit alcohol dehydrogenase family)